MMQRLFRFSLLLSALVAVAAMDPPSQPITLSPEQAVKEGRALVDEMLSGQPDANSVSGTMAIRRGKSYREIPIKFDTTLSPTNWISDYAAVDKDRVEHFLIYHTPHQTNTYRQFSSASNGGNVSPSQPVKNIWAPFADSDFSIADLGLEFLQWPDQKLLQKEMRRSRSCQVLESTNPHPEQGGYSKVKSWIVDDESHGILLARAFDAKGNKLKEFVPEKFSKASGQWQLEKMQITNRQGDTTTVTFDVK
jgi:hypothetical protein